MKFLNQYWKSVVITLIILVLSFAKFPTVDSLQTINHWDKLIHFFMYFGLTIVVMYDFHQDKSQHNKKWVFILICLLFPFFLGGVTELLQSYLFASRVGSVYDWLSNILGFLTGWGIFSVYKKRIKT